MRTKRQQRGIAVMTKDTAIDLIGAAALSLTTIVLLWLPAMLQV